MWRAPLEGLLDLLAPYRCPGCDVVLDWGQRGFCDACGLLVEPLRSGPALFAYGGPLAVGIKGLKYGKRVDYTDALSALLVTGWKRHAGRVDEVVPIPLHETRLRERGFNQSELLAVPLANALGVPLRNRITRTHAGVAQASLPQAIRSESVRHSFVAKPGAKRVLLIDDVRTTGATLRAATGALHKAGTHHVRIMALAGVEP